MKRFSWLLIIWLSLIILLSACGMGASDSTRPTITRAAETYQIGEPVPFMVDEMVYVCQYYDDQIPYTILQVTQAGEHEVALRHSCIGFIAQGYDEYCEDGKVRTENVEVGNCSDDVGCGTLTIQEIFTWDQQAYVKVTEDCGGETIVREVRQQVPTGQYKVVIQQQTEVGEIVTEVVKEFVIVE